MKQSLFLLLILAGCTSNPCAHRSGNYSKEKRTLPSFQYLNIRKNIEVKWVIDSAFYVEVEGGENSNRFVETKVESDTLQLFDKNKCMFLRDLSQSPIVTVHAPYLGYVGHWGTNNFSVIGKLKQPKFEFRAEFWSGDLKIDSMETDSAFIRIVSGGAADIWVSGKSTYFYGFFRGLGNMHLKNLQSETGHFVSWTTGFFEIAAPRDMLLTELYRAGNITCFGTPKSVKKDRFGSGDLIFK